MIALSLDTSSCFSIVEIDGALTVWDADGPRYITHEKPWDMADVTDVATGLAQHPSYSCIWDWADGTGIAPTIPPLAFADDSAPATITVLVTDASGSWRDAIKGQSVSDAMTRAGWNWPGCTIELVGLGDLTEAG